MAQTLDGPHRRYNPLNGRHVLVSPQRLQRPWQGAEATSGPPASVSYDPACYLCPGNTRANGERNPDYEGPFVFDNDFAALRPDAASEHADESGLLVAHPESGRCRVLCFSPRHDLSLSQLDDEALGLVVDCWRSEYEALGSDEAVNYVQIFENKGELMGCSNPHPHGQIWAQASVPDEAALELRHMKAWFERRGTPLLMDYVRLELERAERLVTANEHFAAVVPYWASWPFETLVLPLRQLESLSGLDAEQGRGLASLLGTLTRAYDRLFGVPFPYSSGFHQAPTDGASYPWCTLHMHFFPPLLRSATVRKFMVGYEMFAEAQRDLTPESAAERLRACVD